jgi:hypothetical protein
MKRTTFDENRDPQEPAEPQQRSYRCPAFGCPNAASVSFDHGARWACFAHAKASTDKWQQVTHEIRQGWPATANWNHPEKVAYEAEQAAKRRAALPPRRVIAPAGAVSMSGALAPWEGAEA